MSKKIMIGLFSVALLTVFIAQSAYSLTFRIKRSVDNIHTCSEGQKCYGAKRVMDRLFGAEIVELEEGEDCPGFEKDGKCYTITCEMTGTLVCQTLGECGVVENTLVGLTESSFQSEVYFANETATGITFLEYEVGNGYCSDLGEGSFLDYLPNAIVAFTTYYDENDSPFYKFIDVCPGATGDTYNCGDPVFESEVPSEVFPIKLPCCGEPTTLNVYVTGLGTVTSNDGNINCGDGGEECEKEYGTEPPYDTCPEVELTASPSYGYEFAGWGGNGGCTGTGICQPTLKASTEVTATFTYGYTLTVIILNGDPNDLIRIFKSDFSFEEPVPGDKCLTDVNLDESVCTGKAAPGTWVTLKKQGDNIEWSGDCGGVPNSVDQCSLEMTEPKTVVVTFSPEELVE